MKKNLYRKITWHHHQLNNIPIAEWYTEKADACSFLTQNIPKNKKKPVCYTWKIVQYRACIEGAFLIVSQNFRAYNTYHIKIIIIILHKLLSTSKENKNSFIISSPKHTNSRRAYTLKNIYYISLNHQHRVLILVFINSLFACVFYIQIYTPPKKHK